MAAATTPAQTIGPFFGVALPTPAGPELVPEGCPGALVLSGTVYDGAGEPVPDALLEIWQADAAGRFPAGPEDLARADPPGFTGFGRCPTDAAGGYWFRTIAPGPVPDPHGQPQAPHLDLVVFARGLLGRLVTRVYLPGPQTVLDPVLASLADDAQRASLLARVDGDRLRHDIRLQGQGETVFFRV